MEAEGHSLSAGMDKGIITDFAMEARNQLIKEENFTAVRALNFLVCGAIDEPHLPADGSIREQFLCVRSDYLVKLAREFCDTDRVLFAHGLMPRDWLLVSELAECAETRMRESHGFSESASNVLVASDGSGGSRDTPKRLRQVAFERGHLLLANPQWLICRQRIGFLGGQMPGRQILGQSSGEPFKLSVVLTKRPTSSV